jgi:hypothetical protein
VRRLAVTLASALVASAAAATDFGTRGGPEPDNIDAIVETLRSDPYDLELFISFGTSKGGSAGHLALGVRDLIEGDDLVYSANFYADRSRRHEDDFYTDDLMIAVPKNEYLFGTRSSLGDKASFVLDFGEVYKRSIIGVRVYGVPEADKQALQAHFQRINDDYRRRARDTEYHDGEVKYDYLRLNCAKTIGAGFLLRDFRREQGRYEDYDNLYAMYLLYNLAKYSVRLDEASRSLEIDLRKSPMAFGEAAALATRDALADNESYLRGLPVPPKGTAVE